MHIGSRRSLAFACLQYAQQIVIDLLSVSTSIYTCEWRLIVIYLEYLQQTTTF
jgi:hypothetical protein